MSNPLLVTKYASGPFLEDRPELPEVGPPGEPPNKSWWPWILTGAAALTGGAGGAMIPLFAMSNESPYKKHGIILGALLGALLGGGFGYHSFVASPMARYKQHLALYLMQEARKAEEAERRMKRQQGLGQGGSGAPPGGQSGGGNPPGGQSGGGNPPGGDGKAPDEDGKSKGTQGEDKEKEVRMAAFRKVAEEEKPDEPTSEELAAFAQVLASPSILRVRKAMSPAERKERKALIERLKELVREVEGEKE